MSEENQQRPASPGGSLDIDIPLSGLQRKDTIHLTPYSAPLLYDDNDDDAQTGTRGRPQTQSRSREDQRSPSMQSLLPVDSNRDGRRTLLLIYIHGFVGSDTSFQKFPAHVHNLLAVMLSESHVVHSKIYPRYKTRKVIEFVRDDFSHWLSPHEYPETDVVLVGHSLGGILAAEVTLLGPSEPLSPQMFKHRIMGTINLDVPFLGLHRGVVTTGIGSLFRPKKDKKDDPQNQPFPVDSSILAPLFSSPVDPHFNPAFPNDIRLTERSQLDGAMNFIFKNSNHLVDATKRYISSHVEFGFCIADYPGLKRRYKRLRELEDIDEYSQMRDGSGRLFRRIRFVNYYTAATGRIKSPVRGSGEGALNRNLVDGQPTSSGPTSSPGPGHVRSLSVDPKRRNEEQVGEMVSAVQVENGKESTAWVPVLMVQPANSSPENPNTTTPFEAVSPDISPPLYQPPEFNPSLYDSKEHLKKAKKEHFYQVKAYERALKDKGKKVKAHNKLVSKQERAAEKERLKQAKETANTPSPHTDPEPLLPLLSPSLPSSPASHIDNLSPASGAPNSIDDIESACSTPPINTNAHSKIKKDRKFCALPPREANGERDPLWVRVYMEGVDEVTAHQSLFVSRNAGYDRLVGDVAARIEGWVQDDLTAQMIRNDCKIKK
ncbi:hypothetical protein PABG_04562 [Paracoccidioides brasiliensis Pb03]|nr:hypothetical protein PABG_04562 [Paracoccidioides brasiliensis Pb03]